MSEIITVFDIEVLNADSASICAIGLVRLEDFQVTNTYYSLVRPHNLSFDPYRYNVHHIKINDLKKARSFKDIWREILPYFDHQLVCAHDVQGDMACIRAALKRDRLPYPSCQMACSNVLAHLIEPDLEKYNVKDLCEHFHLPLENAHHALDDALACSRIVTELVKRSGYDSLRAVHKAHSIPFGEMHSNYYRNIISPEHAAMNSKKIHKLTNLSIAFTGNMVTSKEELLEQLKKVKAFYNRDVNTHTAYLVVGAIGYKRIRYSGTNHKILKAKALQKEGQDLKIIHENEYLELLKK